MLNTLSIKKRLIILVLSPLLLLTLLIGERVNESVFRLEQLNKLKYRLELLSESLNLNAVLHDVRVAKLNETSEVNTAALTQSTEKLLVLAPLALHNSTDAMQLLSDLVGAEEELDYLTAEDVNDWSSWVADSTSQLLLILEKNSLDIDDKAIIDNLDVLYQLQWLYFWANEENWYINLVIKGLNNDEDSTLSSIVERQQLFIERFIAISADNNQISLLQNTFSDQAFMDSYALRNIIQSGHFQRNADTYNISALDKRLALIRDVVANVSSNLSTQIQVNIAEAKMHVIAFTVFIIALLLCTAYIGWMLIQRIIGNLKDIITTLMQIEDKNDYSLKLQVDGKDEFSEFAKILNKLIEERGINERQIIQAKESAEQANVAKSSFLANMSHEIRTPLNGVIGMSNVLSSTKLTPTQQDHLAIIENSSQTLLILINDILDFSKIESGHLAITQHNCNLREVIYDTMAIVIPSASAKQLDLVVKIDPNLPDDLLVDEHRLRQVLMNLLSNAVKFTENGQICLTLNCQLLVDNRCELYFSVADTGTGIEESKQQKIFEPFTQEDGSITREFGGTGLGLAISTQLVELMGGKIEVNSNKGEGSNFYFSIEVDFAAASRAQSIVPIDTLITVIANEQGFANEVCEQLIHHHMTRVNPVAYMQDLAHCGENKTSDQNTKQVVIYCQSSISLTLKDIDFVNRLRLKYCLVLIQSHTDEKYDFDHRIDGLVTMPLLGNRLLKTIQAALNNKFELSTSTNSSCLDEQKQVDNYGVNDTDNALILIVEDNLVNQKVAKLILEQAGYDCHIANNGKEAVDMVSSAQYQYKAILMDCMMPVMDGFTATQHIREWETTTLQPLTPIIALTASVLDEDIQRCFDVGMNDYVAKPFKKDALIEKIERRANVA